MTEEQKDLQCTYNALYQEEIDYFYSLSEERQKELLKATEEQIEQLEPCEKELAKKMGALLLAIRFCEDLLEDPINEKNINDTYIDRYKYIEEARRFFEKENSEDLFQKYGIIDTYESGDFKQEEVIDLSFEDSGFKVNTDEKRFKHIFQDLWQNHKQFPSEQVMNDESIKRNGIGFKQFLFCEEYIKQGKITKTAESLGIGRTTCYDYLKQDEVKQYLETRRKEIKQESDDLLKTGFFDCFNELHQIVTKDTPRQDKLKAIDIYLKHYEQSIYKTNEIQE